MFICNFYWCLFEVILGLYYSIREHFTSLREAIARASGYITYFYLIQL